MGLRILIPRPTWRRSLGRMRRFVWVALGIGLWATASSVVGANGMVGAHRAWTVVERLEQELAESQAENRALEAEIRDLKSDRATIERLAREEFFLGKPGERVYLLPPRPAAERVDAGSDAMAPDLTGDLSHPGGS